MMSASLDLKEIEKRAYRSTFQDGLWDIYAGGIVASAAILASTLGAEETPWVKELLYVVGMVLSGAIFWAGKRFITLPRMGQVKFGPRRRRRGVTLALILAVIVLIQVGIVLFQFGGVGSPAWRAQLGLALSNPQTGRLAVAVLGALFVGPSMTLIAYFADFGRGYYIAIVMSLAVFMEIWFKQPLLFLAAASLIFLPGLFLFVRFLRKYPLPPAEARHGG